MRCLLIQVVVNIVAVVFVVLLSCFPTVVVVDAVVVCRRINLLVKSEALMAEIRRQFCDGVKYFNCFSRLKFCLKLRVSQTLLFVDYMYRAFEAIIARISAVMPMRVQPPYYARGHITTRIQSSVIL